jgi:hypothetical protein
LERQQRILKFVTRTNWILFFLASILGFILAPTDFARGILFGGLLVTVNFHMLYRTLKKALQPPHLSSVGSILAKYYIRFVVSGIIIFFLIFKNIVHPLGLFVGLSVVVASIMLASLCEFSKLIFKEAT